MSKLCCYKQVTLVAIDTTVIIAITQHIQVAFLDKREQSIFRSMGINVNQCYVYTHKYSRVSEHICV